MYWRCPAVSSVLGDYEAVCLHLCVLHGTQYHSDIYELIEEGLFQQPTKAVVVCLNRDKFPRGYNYFTEAMVTELSGLENYIIRHLGGQNYILTLYQRP